MLGCGRSGISATVHRDSTRTKHLMCTDLKVCTYCTPYQREKTNERLYPRTTERTRQSAVLTPHPIDPPELQHPQLSTTDGTIIIASSSSLCRGRWRHILDRRHELRHGRPVPLLHARIVCASQYRVSPHCSTPVLIANNDDATHCVSPSRTP